MIFLRANSHRAYQRLFQLCPDAKEKSFYLMTNLWHDKAKGYWQIPDDMLDEALKIPGITKARSQDQSNYGLAWR